MSHASIAARGVPPPCSLCGVRRNISPYAVLLASASELDPFSPRLPLLLLLPPPAPPYPPPTTTRTPITTPSRPTLGHPHRTKMSRAGTTATLERPDERTDRDLLSAALLAPTRGSPASSSHSLLISSNLRAALEFEERIRTPLPGSPNRAGSISAAGGTADWGGGPQQGLPPPPRPKSRPTKAAHAHASQSSPAGPVSSPASPVSAPQATDGSSAGANPYINPVPQLSHLIREEPPLVMGDQQQADTQSIGHGSNDSHGTGSSRASPTVSSASPSPSTGGKPESPRHIRGLSSLQKMEKMIGKSKKMLVEGNLKLPGGRRAVDASRVGSGELGRRTKAASVLYASSAPSSPISAVSVSLGGMRRVESGQRAASTGEGKPAAVATGGRGGDSHGVGGTAEGTGSWTPITDSEPSPRPISISSTIYPSSTRSFTPPSRSPASRPAMNDHRESFIELASPTFSPTDARATFASFRDEQRPPQQRDSLFPDEFSFHPYASTKPLLAPLSTGKPPIPTSAKPDFSSRRSKSAQRAPVEEPSPNTPSPSEPSPDYERGLRNRPSTSNLLQPHERADLVRKTRKLTQLFGQTPGVGHYPVEVDFGRGHAARTNLVGAVPHPSRRRKHKPAASMLDDPIVPVYDAQKRVVWPPAEEGQYASAGARRRSVPLSPAEYSAVGSALSVSVGGHVIEIGSAEGTAAWSEGSGASGGSENSHADLAEREASGSPESFIDLSDEEDPAAFPDSRSPATPKGYLLPPRSDSLLSPSTPSLDALSLSSEQLAEEDRRRKRERLAKLHRFLGSRVPAHLVLGPLEEGVPLPPPASPSPQDDMYGEDADARKLRLRRRRSSSAAEFAGTWSDEIDRLKEDLNDREKAINVRRAVKMEKVRRVQRPPPPMPIGQARTRSQLTSHFTPDVWGGAAPGALSHPPGCLIARKQ